MKESTVRTSERMLPYSFHSREEYLLYLRHLFAYEFAKSSLAPDSNVLEMGSGEGYGTDLLSHYVANITGLDVEIETVAIAQRKYISDNLLFRLYDGVRIPYEDNRFDAVVSFQVIEHVKDDRNYVAEIYRVLKKGGIFILTTPNSFLRLKPGQKPFNRFHIREYNHDELKTLLLTKFQDVEVWGIRGKEEAQQIELESVRQSQRLVSLDPLYIRRIIPAALKRRFIKFMKRISNPQNDNKNDKEFIQRYGLADFYIIKENINDSLDLLGVLKK
jgi:SAM-dependent methyltransferase